MRWLHQDYITAQNMPAKETMNFFKINYCGELDLFFGSFNMKSKKGKMGIVPHEVPKEWIK